MHIQLKVKTFRQYVLTSCTDDGVSLSSPCLVISLCVNTHVCVHTIHTGMCVFFPFSMAPILMSQKLPLLQGLLDSAKHLVFLLRLMDVS